MDEFILKTKLGKKRLVLTLFNNYKIALLLFYVYVCVFCKLFFYLYAMHSKFVWALKIVYKVASYLTISIPKFFHLLIHTICSMQHNIVTENNQAHVVLYLQQEKNSDF